MMEKEIISGKAKLSGKAKFLLVFAGIATIIIIKELSVFVKSFCIVIIPYRQTRRSSNLPW